MFASILLQDSSINQKSAKMNQEREVRKKILFIFSEMKKLMAEGKIVNFSILRSSLEQVFKNILLGKNEKKNYTLNNESQSM